MTPGDKNRIDEIVEEGLGGPVEKLLPELADRRVLRRPDGPLADTVQAERPVTVRDLLTFTWGFGMHGAMFMSPDPWPIVTAVEERELASFGPPKPVTTPEPDTWMARLSELPLLAQPGCVLALLGRLPGARRFGRRPLGGLGGRFRLVISGASSPCSRV